MKEKLRKRRKRTKEEREETLNFIGTTLLLLGFGALVFAFFVAAIKYIGGDLSLFYKCTIGVIILTIVMPFFAFKD